MQQTASPHTLRISLELRTARSAPEPTTTKHNRKIDVVIRFVAGKVLM